MAWAVVVFPGSNCDWDCYHALQNVLGVETRMLWHTEPLPDDTDGVVLPGGFSYGDYLRPGAIAKFAPAMKSVRTLAEAGRPVIGICNGFQVLTEAGLLPGALMRNNICEFRCQYTHLRVERHDTLFTAQCPDVVRVPIAHGDGNYFICEDGLKALQDKNQIAFRYCEADGTVSAESNPNGSIDNIAGIINETGNVLGMMPHPERVVEGVIGGEDGLPILRSMLETVGV